MNRIEDFVKAGQAAQAAVDKLTGRQPSTAQIAADAATISTRLLAIIRQFDDAAAHRAHKRHTNAASLEQLARAQLRQLMGELDVHFRRFLPAASCYRCTCGYELRGAELEKFLAESYPHTPSSIRCPKCAGVAVRSTS